jgi:hemoglobin
LSFYEKVRHDPVLGPVFAEAIGGDWTPHIERIVLFWLTATGLQRGYEGRNFMPAHLRHASVRAELLPRWLELFRQTTVEHCAPEPARALVGIAERMAQTLEILGRTSSRGSSRAREPLVATSGWERCR